MSRCPYCNAQPLQRKNAKTCGLPSCQRANKAVAGRASHQREAERRKADKLSTAARVIVRRIPDTNDVIEQAYQAAKAARLAEERRNGQRRYTITDGWAQKGGAGRINLDLGTRWAVYQ
jgi:hypothetical protein